MNLFVSMTCLALAIAYYDRVRALQFRKNDAVFVSLNVLLGTACLYSAFELVHEGFTPLRIMMPIVAALYFIRSRDSFITERAQSMPVPLDEALLNRVFGDRK